jgi:uncharacterized metal-binding protein
VLCVAGSERSVRYLLITITAIIIGNIMIFNYLIIILFIFALTCIAVDGIVIAIEIEIEIEFENGISFTFLVHQLPAYFQTIIHF